MPLSPRLLRPRASGGFDPRSISGLAAWWDAADSSTLFDATTGGSLVAADGGVGRWQDKSGNGRHATQGTAGSRPLRKTSRFNGRDALLFDGSDDVFYVDDFYVNQHTFFAVYRSANNASRHTVVRKGFQTGATLEWLLRSTDATTVTHFAASATNVSAAATAVAGSLRLATGRYDKTQVTCSVNGGPASATAFTSDILDTAVRLRIGAGFADNQDAGALSEQLSGEICELLLYNRALSASEVATVNRYMANKWGIALSPYSPPAYADADVNAYISNVEAADGQMLESATRDAINSFVTGCKADGTWGSIKACCLLMGARTLSGALTPLVGAAPTNNFFVSGDYNRRGLLGDGATKFLNTNRANNADPRDNQHFSAWVSQASTQVAASIGASTAATAGSSAIGQDASAYTLRSRHASSAGGVSPTAATSTGFFGASRSNSASYDYRAAGLAGSFSIASDAPTSATFNVFVTNGGAAFSNGRISYYSIGESLDLALLDARVTALVNAIGAAIP